MTPIEVLVVVDAGEVRLDDAHPLAPARQRQHRAPANHAGGDLERPVGARARAAVSDHLAAGPARHLHCARRRGAGHQQAVLGDERHELAERGVHRLLVAEDVGVIELHRRQERDARPVVQELGSLVEEGGVVLVPLDDELATRPQPPGLPEVERHAADQK